MEFVIWVETRLDGRTLAVREGTATRLVPFSITSVDNSPRAVP